MPAASSTENDASFAYAPGDLIAAKYLLEQLLAEGGMGAVFRARNTALDMPVAVKLLRADLSRELLAGRLLQEARAAAKLAHPAIVRVFDVGQTALGDPFIVMELLEGETLAALIDREQRLSAIRAVQLLLPIADALSAAHAKGLVHRDVKPDNVLLVSSDEGIVQPKLLDFGIVKSAQPDGSAPSDAGSVVGSPDYMSPEQARGLERVDARSDLWSFSVVLYEAIAGVVPFQSSTYATLLRMIVEDQPKSLKELGVADHALSYIVGRGLSKDPLARYASLSQMGKSLAAWLADQGIAEDACGVSLEAKWLARTTDPHGLRRVSWPPPARAEQIPGVHHVDLNLAKSPIVTPERTIPGAGTAGLASAPSSLVPVAESIRGSRVASWPRRSLLLAAAVVSVGLLSWLASSSVLPQPQPSAAVLAAAHAAPTVTPVTIASTVKPVLSSQSASNIGKAAVTPAENAGGPALPVPPTRPRPAKPSRKLSAPSSKAPSSGARPSSSATARPEPRASDVLAPMPF